MLSLQENNAMAVLDVRTATITSLHALGFKDHSNPRNPLDPSDRDGPAAKIANWPVFGLYQPDEMKSFRCGWWWVLAKMDASCHFPDDTEKAECHDSIWLGIVLLGIYSGSIDHCA
jgi:hypothetical protein